MNRYPRWIYVTIAVALALGLLYTLPNFFGEAPAVQVSTARTTLKIDSTVLGRVEDALKKAGIQPTGVFLDINSVKVRFADTDTQLKAKDVINQALNPDPQDPSYTVALNLLSNSPAWLAAIPIIPARPMYLGLDLRGGVHFLLQVDMRAALSKQLDSYVGDIRSQLRDKNVRHAGIARESNGIAIQFRDSETRDRARTLVAEQFPDLQLADAGAGSELRLIASIRPEAQKRVQETALKQNAAQPHQRAGRRRARDPAAGPGPRGSGAPWRARYREGEGDPRPHRDTRSAAGGRGRDALQQHNQRGRLSRTKARRLGVQRADEKASSVDR